MLFRSSLNGNEKVAQIAAENEAVIAGKVLAESIGTGEDLAVSKEWNVNGETVTIGIQKI